MVNIGKIKALKQIINNSELIHLIRAIGDKATVSAEMLDDAKRFVQTVLYSEKDSESLMDTRVHLYKGRKQISLASLPLTQLQ